MAEVFLAYDRRGKPGEELVALKRMLPVLAEDHNFIAMFIDEGRLLGQLKHNNILRIFDMGNQGDIYFQSLEYIFGVSLRNLWEITWHTERFPIPLATLITQRIATALDLAHKKRDRNGRSLNIIHRDVSPQNILVSFSGDIKVIDFGIAKAADRIANTRRGVIKGKVTYMAPEQAKGLSFDHRIDIYALGLIYYELVTGRRAFKGKDDFELLQNVREGRLHDMDAVLAEIPSEVAEVIRKATHTNPEHRYKWASEFSEDLSRLMTNANWRPGKDDLAALTKKIFRTHYRAQKKRVRTYLELGQTGFEFEKTQTTGRAQAPQAVAPFTEISLEPETEFEGINSGSKTRTDPFVPGSPDLTLADAAMPPNKSSNLKAQPPSLAWPLAGARNPEPKSEHHSKQTPSRPSRGEGRSHVWAIGALMLCLGVGLGSLVNRNAPRVAVTSSPKGAAVFCDNKPVCANTPCVFEAACESKKYVVQKKGYYFETLKPNLDQEYAVYHFDLKPQLNQVR